MTRSRIFRKRRETRRRVLVAAALATALFWHAACPSEPVLAATPIHSRPIKEVPVEMTVTTVSSAGVSSSTISEFVVHAPRGAQLRVRCGACGTAALARGVGDPEQIKGVRWSPSLAITVAVSLPRRYGRFIEIRGGRSRRPQLCVAPGRFVRSKCPHGTANERKNAIKGLVNKEAPQVHGSPVPGTLLACSKGVWGGAPFIRYSYTWLRDEAPLPDTQPTHILDGADEHHVIACEVTAEDGSGGQKTARSLPLKIHYSPVSLALPIVVGVPVAGKTLRCVPGEWDGEPAPAVTDTWVSNGVVVESGSLTYKIRPQDEARLIACEETASNGIGKPRAVISEAVQIYQQPQSTRAPTISGEARLEGTLACGEGAWEGMPPPTVTVSWLRDGVPIVSGALRSYQVRPEDEGHSLSCLETATNEAGTNSRESLRLAIPKRPRNIAPPQVTGSFVVDANVECHSGEWEGTGKISFTYHWLSNGVQILGADHQVLTIEPFLEGTQVSCEVTAINEGGRSVEWSAPRTVVGVPKLVAPPQLAGVLVVGGTAECEHGTWDGLEPISYSIKWLRDGVPLAGRSGKTYSVGSQDGGHTLQCEVTASNRLGEASAFSGEATVAAVPFDIEPPEISGIVHAGETLSCGEGEWIGEEPISFSVHWLREGGRITGAVGTSYVLQAGDEGASVSCEVTATNLSGSITVISPAVRVQARPRNTALPTISGGLRTGDSITCKTGTWVGDEPIEYAYRWLRNGAPIAGATHSSYVLASVDEGEPLECEVTASNDVGVAHAFSPELDVPALPVNEVLPSISGEPAPGEILKCAAGTWRGTEPIGFAFRWRRNEAPIAGAKESSYRLGAADEDSMISCEVIASNAAGSAVVLSPAVSVSAKAREQKESEVITSFDTTKGDLAPYSGVFTKAQQPFTARFTMATHVGVTIGNPGIPDGASADTVTIKLCSEPFCREESELGNSPVRAQVNNYGLSSGNFAEPVDLQAGETYYLVWTPPSDTHGSHWFTFWHGGTASIGGATGMEAVVRGFEFFAEENGGDKLISYLGTAPPPAPFAGAFAKATQAFEARSNRISKVGVVLGNPKLSRGKQAPESVHVQVCSSPSCGATELGSGEALITNYGVTTVSLGSIPVTIGGTYYVVWSTPAAFELEPWQAFWQGNGATPELATAYEMIVQGWDEGSASFHPHYVEEQAGSSSVSTYRAHEVGAGEGVHIPASDFVEVSCKVFDPAASFVEPDGYWYEIHSPPWKDEYFAPANGFRNGALSDETLSTDYGVPDC